MEHPLKILESYFNYTSFKPLQEKVIEHVISGEDTFVLMPTGGGKSLCFQIPALAKKGICIVISPLIALMKDQVNALNKKGIKAIALTSGMTQDELSAKLDNCIYGNYKFLYLSPERLQQDIVQHRIQQMPVNLIAVDEAHCISQWGNDFRPSYKNISILRQLHPTINVVALTASATPNVVEDIIKELDFISYKKFQTSFKRDNLAYMVFKTEDKNYRLETILVKNKASSIVYVRNRKATIEVSQYLKSKGVLATFYHGGLSSLEKNTNYELWMNNQAQVMVATNAFGMGIDKPDVKTVIHLNLPESLESYFQEAGRAGRNGHKAYAIILYNGSDEPHLKHQFLSVLPDVTYVKYVYKKLNTYFQIAYGEQLDKVFDFDFASFCKKYELNFSITYNALLVLDRTGIIALSKQFSQNTFVQFTTSNHALFSYLDTHEKLALITKSILRTYGGIFDHVTKINKSVIVKKVGCKDNDIDKVLQQLEKDDIITLQQNKTDASIVFLVPREDDSTINSISKIIKQQNKLKVKQVTSVLNYIENDSTCKSQQLLGYFGETTSDTCGICSVCIKPQLQQSKKNAELELQILELLKSKKLNSRELSHELTVNEQLVLKTISQLLEHNKIEITASNCYKLKI